MKTVLVIGYVWPEPFSSAAGLKTMNVVDALLDKGWKVAFASSGAKNPRSEALLSTRSVPGYSIEINGPALDCLLTDLQPDAVIFDRFVCEEQFGWRVAAICPKAFQIVDTQDLHFVRKARQRFVQQLTDVSYDPKVLEIGKQTNPLCLDTEDVIREVGSIFRSDLSWIISRSEMELLVSEYGVPKEKLAFTPFYYSSAPEEGKSFEDRQDFVMIGNLRHAPNQNAVRWMKKKIWPKIRKKCPKARLRVYGAYPNPEIMKCHSELEGFLMMGPAESSFEVLRRARVNLAPLNFGAGIKGKITDSWMVGTPVVTTPVGAEGMLPDDSFFAGAIVGKESLPQTLEDEFAEKACLFHTNPVAFQAAQQKAKVCIEQFFSKEKVAHWISDSIERLFQRDSFKSSEDLLQKTLRYHAHRSHRYFSKWIELKNLQERESLLS